MKKLSIILINYIFLLIILLSESIFCQIPTKLEGERLGSTLTVIGKDNNYPDYHTDMPIDCIKGYILMDSVTQSDGSMSILKKTLTWDIYNLRKWVRYLYAVSDYEPLLLRSYIKRIPVKIATDSAAEWYYTSYPSNVYYGIENAIKNKIEEFGKDYALLFIANCIYKIRVDTVATGIDTSYGKNHPMPWLNARCTLKEKIKGTYVPQDCFYRDSICITFGYPMIWLTGTCFSKERGKKSETRIKEVKTGEEYFVFLQLISLDLRYWNDVITPVMHLEQSGGLFRIKDDFVEDDYNFWGLGTRPTVEQFRSHLDSLIDNIKSW